MATSILKPQSQKAQPQNTCQGNKIDSNGRRISFASMAKEDQKTQSDDEVAKSTRRAKVRMPNYQNHRVSDQLDDDYTQATSEESDDSDEDYHVPSTKRTTTSRRNSAHGSNDSKRARKIKNSTKTLCTTTSKDNRELSEFVNLIQTLRQTRAAPQSIAQQLHKEVGGPKYKDYMKIICKETPGVYFKEEAMKCIAQKRINGVLIHIGSFHLPEEASREHDAFTIELGLKGALGKYGESAEKAEVERIRQSTRAIDRMIRKFEKRPATLQALEKDQKFDKATMKRKSSYTEFAALLRKEGFLYKFFHRICSTNNDSLVPLCRDTVKFYAMKKSTDHRDKLSADARKLIDAVTTCAANNSPLESLIPLVEMYKPKTNGAKRKRTRNLEADQNLPLPKVPRKNPIFPHNAISGKSFASMTTEIFDPQDNVNTYEPLDDEVRSLQNDSYADLLLDRAPFGMDVPLAYNWQNNNYVYPRLNTPKDNDFNQIPRDIPESFDLLHDSFRLPNDFIYTQGSNGMVNDLMIPMD